MPVCRDHKHLENSIVGVIVCDDPSNLFNGQHFTTHFADHKLVRTTFRILQTLKCAVLTVSARFFAKLSFNILSALACMLWNESSESPLEATILWQLGPDINTSTYMACTRGRHMKLYSAIKSKTECNLQFKIPFLVISFHVRI